MIPPKSRLIAMTLAAAAGCSSHGTEKSRDEAVDGALEESECPATVARSKNRRTTSCNSPKVDPSPHGFA